MNKRAALLDHVPGPKAAFHAIMVKKNHGIGVPEWFNWLNVRLLISAQVISSRLVG